MSVFWWILIGIVLSLFILIIWCLLSAGSDIDDKWLGQKQYED